MLIGRGTLVDQAPGPLMINERPQDWDEYSDMGCGSQAVEFLQILVHSNAKT
jgi:hypothetical protein